MDGVAAQILEVLEIGCVAHPDGAQQDARARLGVARRRELRAVDSVRPYAVDVDSGVESAPGRKDADKVRRFVAEARRA